MKEFVNWLIVKKNYTTKSAHDVQSRLKRVQTIVRNQDIVDNTIAFLEKEGDFQCLTVSVKSQLRRTVRLYLQYELDKDGNY